MSILHDLNQLEAWEVVACQGDVEEEGFGTGCLCASQWLLDITTGVV